MNQFVTESKPISLRSSCLVVLLTLMLATLLPAQQPPPDGVKFEVISVRVLSDSEAADRSPDFVGPNIAVRLRLSSVAHGISFYGWKNSAIPAGYKVQRTDQAVVWLYGKGGTEKKASSPGLKAVLFHCRVERLDYHCPAHQLAHMRPVLLLDVGIVVFLIGPSAGKLDITPGAPAGHLPIEKLRAVVGIDAQEAKGHGLGDLLQGRRHSRPGHVPKTARDSVQPL